MHLKIIIMLCLVNTRTVIRGTLFSFSFLFFSLGRGQILLLSYLFKILPALPTCSTSSVASENCFPLNHEQPVQNKFYLHYVQSVPELISFSTIIIGSIMSHSWRFVLMQAHCLSMTQPLLCHQHKAVALFLFNRHRAPSELRRTLWCISLASSLHPIIDRPFVSILT